MDFSTILAGIPAALDCGKKALDLVKGAKELAPKESKESGTLTDALGSIFELQAKLLETQGLMLEAQRIMNATEQRAADAERKLREQDEWNTEAARYGLRRMDGTGSFIYSLKDDQANGQPLHHLCPVCFEKRKKSILQESQSGASAECKSCNLTFPLQPYSSVGASAVTFSRSRRSDELRGLF